VTDRDELAALIERNADGPDEYQPQTPRDWAEFIADAIIAAGWIKRSTVIPSYDIDPNAVRNTCGQFIEGQFIEWDDTTQRWVHA